MQEAGQLHVTTWGDEGETAVLVHGSLGWGEYAWAAQRSLADEYRLLLVDRRGFGSSPGPDAGDFDVDADFIAELLPSDAHLVGHSYGGVASLLAAARRPDAVRSLTVIEPPALGLIRGDEAVEEFITRVSAATSEAADPQDYTRRFFAAFGLPSPTDPSRETRCVRRRARGVSDLHGRQSSISRPCAGRRFQSSSCAAPGTPRLRRRR